jgi:hypothetical protein
VARSLLNILVLALEGNQNAAPGLTIIQQCGLKNRRQPQYFLCLNLAVFKALIVLKDERRYNPNHNSLSPEATP